VGEEGKEKRDKERGKQRNQCALRLKKESLVQREWILLVEEKEGETVLRIVQVP
jgi:hypothetical protein